MGDRPRVLIEDWLPVAELGIESRRERAAASALPPLSFLHVWWARRPLVASAGVILASLLPPWSTDLADRHADRPELKSADEYKRWILRLCGILGDPVAAKKELDAANAAGVKLRGNGYGYRQAFRNSPATGDLALLHGLLEETWGGLPSVIDPTAGGGAIPFEAIRYGLRAVANDLNPIAASVLRSGVELPAKHGTSLVHDLEMWGATLCKRVRQRLEASFPLAEPGESVIAYIYARTVACPRTGKQVPLSPTWWLRKDSGKQAAVRVVTERGGVELEEVEFEIVTGRSVSDLSPDRGTVAGGDAISLWDNLAIDGDYIKAEAQAGRMDSTLYAVATRIDGERRFRAPSARDLEGIAAAARELERVRPRWEKEDVLPTEEIDVVSNYDRGHRLYGATTWQDLFTPRQLLVHGTYVEELRSLSGEIMASGNQERSEAIIAELSMMLGKALNWNAIMSSWDVSRQKMRSVFDSHNFAFK